MTPAIIGYYDDSVGRGGTTRYLLDLLQNIDRDRYKPIFFAPRAQEWHSDIRDLDVEIVVALHESAGESSQGVEHSKSHRPRIKLPISVAWTMGLARETIGLVELFRTRRIDLFHSNNTGAEPAPIAAKFAGIPHIIGTWHVDPACDLEHVRDNVRYRLLERRSMKSLQYSIAVSNSTKQAWLQRCRFGEKFARTVSVIPNSVDSQKFKPGTGQTESRLELGIDSEAFVIGSLGRLQAVKGYDYAIRALSDIVRHVPKAVLLVAGTGPEREALRRLANDLNLSDRLYLPGFIADVPKLLSAIDVYIQPSLCEPQGIGILEACSMGIPVVASNVGGIPETVIPGNTGYLCAPKDSVSLANAIVRLAADPERAGLMGQAGRARIIKEFTVQRMVDKTTDIYQSALDSSKKFCLDTVETTPLPQIYMPLEDPSDLSSRT